MDVGNVSVQKIETLVHETGVGVSDRTDVSYAIGAEVDGLFVPFVTLTENHVANLAAAAAANQPAEAEGDTTAEDAKSS